MNDYERLINDALTEKPLAYSYGGKSVEAQTLFLCITVEETCKYFELKDYSGVTAVTMILLGRPWIPTRSKPGGATAGTSIASLVLRVLVDVNFEKAILPTLTSRSVRRFQFSMTRNLGAFIGRWIPWLGATLAVYDVVKIVILSVMRYNQIVNEEDRINDATAGSFG
ncbi:hypothetical protein GXB81_17080 [Paraburkholderia sp. Ac-20336]|uniref:STM2901 family protein n=1 Tax=unclassified Paraburkholderia TaxID=2615204 RepID=UPI00197D5668|nr:MULTISPECIES: hypothetical protein [unclassified Paraburkholderia]MBN3804749.1 hypothetical protein [Paraburkholderia sp. Ac-20336]MBN3847787.1 hypothetical protein [Paraburkholderia sp. Ac-20342]